MILKCSGVSDFEFPLFSTEGSECVRQCKAIVSVK